MPALLGGFHDRHHTDGNGPAVEQQPIVVLFADLSGFTTLAERMGDSPRGAEQLHRILNVHFGRIIDLVAEWGGSVLHFAGDATIATWPIVDGAAGAAVDAMGCARAIQQATDGVEVEPGIVLRQRVIVATGRADLTSVGGLEGKREFLVGGPVWDAVAQADVAARPGDIVPCPEVDRLVRSHAESGVTSTSVAANAIADLGEFDDERVEQYLPERMLAQLTLGDPAWLADFRRATTMFISIAGADTAAKLDAATRAVQRIRSDFEGALVQYLYDDKGLVAIGSWGVALSNHENNAARAVAAGRSILAELAQTGCSGSAGVATGRVFAGLLGNDIRREYAVIGDSMNLAARLMARADNSVLCDDATRIELDDQFDFEVQGAIDLKGKSEPLGVFRVHAERAAASRDQSAMSPMVGRAVEFNETLDGLERGMVVISAEAGSGKSRLAEAVVADAESRGVRTLRGYGDELHRSEPYFPWRPIISALLSDSDRADERFPLLGPLLGLDLEPTEFTRDLTPAGRDDVTVGLLLDVLANDEAGSALLVLDDLHWFDTSSWKLLTLVGRSVSILAMTRPLDRYRVPDEAHRVLTADETHVLSLGPLGPAETTELVAALAGAERVSGVLADAIYQRTEGNPLFVEQLVLSLLDHDLVVFGDGAATLRSSARSQTGDLLPDAVQGAVGARIDRLSPAAQLTLKVASVLGRRFNIDGLAAVHPIADTPDELDGDLDAIVATELVETNAHGYRFRHALIQDTAYDLLVGGQRDTLHRSAAQWHESGSAAPNYGLLAHHWGRTSDDAKAVAAFDAAARGAVTTNANYEVVDFIGRARVRAEASGTIQDHQRAEWDAMAGHAYANLGSFGEATEHLDSALARLNRPQPTSNLQLVRAIAGQLRRQVSHRVRAPERTGTEPANLIAAGCYGRLALIHYNNHDLGRSLLVNLAGINLADTVPFPHVRAQFAINAAITAQAVGATKQAAHYRDVAFDAADEVANELLLVTPLPAMSVFEMGEGRVQRSIEIAVRLHGIAVRAGDPRVLEYANAQLGNSKRFAADYRGSLDAAHELMRIGFDRDVAQTQVWGLFGRTMCYRFLADGEALEATLGPFGELLTDPALRAHISASNIVAYGASTALLALERGEREQAFAGALEAAEAVEGLRTIPAYLACCVGILHDAVRQLQALHSDDARLERLWKASDKFAKSCGRIFAVARPQLLIVDGDRLARQDDRAGATEKWTSAKAAAASMDLPLEHATACDRLSETDERDAVMHRAGICAPIGWLL